MIEAICLATLLSGMPALPQDIVIRNGAVIDASDGSATVATVLIRDGIIAEVAQRLDAPPGAREIDASGKWLIPGLIELHTHSIDPVVLSRALALGVTSTLTIFTYTSDPPSEAASQRPDSPVPRSYLVLGKFSSGLPDTARAAASGMVTPRTIQEVRAALDRYAEQGVARIKIWWDDGSIQRDQQLPALSDELVEAMVTGARARGMEVYFHALQDYFYRKAVALRPSWIIHPIVSGTLTTEDATAIREAGLGWTTVMSIVLARGNASAFARRVLADPRLRRALTASQLERYRRDSALSDNPAARFAPRLASNYRSYLANITGNTRVALDAGLTVALGSDWTAGIGTHIETELLRDAGFEPRVILRAATLGGAEALGIADRFGSIEPGKVADLVVLGANPLEEITNLRAVEYVIKQGRVWSGLELMALP